MNVRQATIKRIRALCDERDVKIEDLVRHCGLDKSIANLISSGGEYDFTLDTMEMMCDYLGVNFAEFFCTDIFMGLNT